MIENIVKFILAYTLCAIYSSWIAFGLGIAYFFKKDERFWKPKSRPTPPQNLTSNEFGEHKYAKVNGINIHYVAKGDPKNPLIIFVHGFPEFWFSWRYQLNEFGKDYYAVALDLRGYGQSDKPQQQSAYHIDNMVDDIRALAEHLGRKKFILIAHDWGALIGFRYVMRHMDTLDKYVMLGAPPLEIWQKSVFSSIKQFFMSWYCFYFQMPKLPELTFSLGDFQAFKTFQIETKEEIEAFKYTFCQEGALTPPINYYRENCRFLFPDQPIPVPTKFVPGLFMLGEGDKYISPTFGDKVQKVYRNLEFKIIPGANHFCQQHKPDETNRLIREFLEKK